MEKGGGTSFAQPGVVVTPEPGSAIFWYSTLSSGDADVETHHGGCPVVFGEKPTAIQVHHAVGMS